MHARLLIPILLFISGLLPSYLLATPADSLEQPSLVFVEGMDEFGRRVNLGTGVIVKNGFVATNYHLVAGMSEVAVYKQGESKKFVSDGYLSVDEVADIILISVPGMEGTPAKLGTNTPPPDLTKVQFLQTTSRRIIRSAVGTVKGKKDILGTTLIQLISDDSEDATSGPVFYQDWTIGFLTAGYLDGKYYAYMVPVKYLNPILNRSFIIKDFNSLSDQKPLTSSQYQSALMESLTSILWVTMEDAERLAKKKNKKILVDVYTDWCGWCKIMEKNTYRKKRIIQYLNENFYAVRLDAEDRDSVKLMGRTYYFLEHARVSELAYSLLDGNMEYPSTVFLDDRLNLLTIIPGNITPEKMEVLLHYFVEDAYKTPGQTFQEYERQYYLKEQD